MTNIWLIRHGEPVASARGRCYGSLDVELSDQGRAQMSLVGQFLRDHVRDQSFAAIYASPRTRAIESARLVADSLSCPLEVEQDLAEIDFGEFEGLSYDEIANLYPAVYEQWMRTPTEVKFPQGESFREMRVRVLNAFDRIRERCSGQTIAVVSHGGTNRILIARALRMPDDAIFGLAQDYAAMNLLSYSDDFALLKLINGKCY